jgi:hypothetical protein
LLIQHPYLIVPGFGRISIGRARVEFQR